MNYRHAYHAGNFADVVKHVILTLVVEHAKLKPAPFRVLDTHAGTGRYDLQALQAAKTGEWQGGIGRLLGPGAETVPSAPAALLAPYLAIVRAENPAGELRTYPGSPMIARRLLRPQDRLFAAELHPEDAAELAACFAGDRQTTAVELDGWTALKAFLPPVERRGIILVDPPYEVRNEFDVMLACLAVALRKFETGTYLLWFPIKDLASIDAFHAGLRRLGRPKILSAEILVRAPADSRRLNGAGLILVNPPWTLPAALERILPFLATRLAHEPGGGHALRWLSE